MTVCLNDREHTEMPRGYASCQTVAEQLIAQGYRQRKCGGCGLYVIWHKDGEALLTWRAVEEVQL